MESLPLELFELVFSHITEHSDLLSLRAVNRFLNTYFTPRAFQVVHFRNTDTSAAHFDDVASSYVAVGIREISFIFTDQGTGAESFMKRSESHSPFATIGAFKSVKTIKLQFPTQYRHNAYQTPLCLESIIFKVLTTSAILPNTFIVRCLRPCVMDPLDFRRFLRHLICLKIHFALPVVCRMDNEHVKDFFNEFAKTWLKPTQANLESLVLDMGRQNLPGLPMRYANIEFSRLKRLQLSNFSFSPAKPTDMEVTILSDPLASCLEELVLNGCICGRGRTHGDLGTWADFFNACRNKLKCLKSFEIDRPLIYGRIVVQCQGCYYTPSSEKYTETDADRGALNALLESIGQCKKP